MGVRTVVVATALAIALSTTACGGGDATKRQRERAAARQAVRDFWLGAEHGDAARFCHAIVGRAQSGRLATIPARGCIHDFHDGAFDGLLSGHRLVSIGTTRLTDGTGRVRIVVRRRGRNTAGDVAVARWAGRWRVVIQAPT